MLRRAEAIVLKTTPYSEADLIVSVLTLDYGLLSVFAKSPRKTKSRFGSSLEPLTHSNIAFWGREDSTLPRLTQADIIRPFQPIREKPKCFFIVMELIELTLSFLPERETNDGIFHLLRSVLIRIETLSAEVDSKRTREFLECLITFYKIRFLDMAGYGPAINGCGRCGMAGQDFYISHGSIICRACTRDTDKPISLLQGTLELYKTLRRWDVSMIERIRPSQLLLSELTNMLDNHIQQHISRPLRTRAFSMGLRESENGVQG